MLEQGLQNLILQKQSFELELSETNSALKELESSSEEVFKIAGNLMIKTNKDEAKKDLKEKQKTLKLRVESIEKQEDQLRDKLDQIRKQNLESKK